MRNVQGVLIKDIEVGTGEAATTNSRVKVMYTGRLKVNNVIFDSNMGDVKGTTVPSGTGGGHRKKPFAFRLGRGEVIRGWEIGKKT